MMFQVGDKVVVKHTNDEGEVIDIINEKMVMLEVRGVKFPAYTDQLEFPYFKRFMEQKKTPAPQPKKYIDEVRTEKKTIAEKIADGVSLSFIPVMVSDEFGDDVVEELKIHLVNRTHKDYHFTYQLHYVGKEGFILKNTIKSFEDFYIHDIDFESLNDSPSFTVEFALVKPEKNKAPYFETHLKLKPKQVFNRISELQRKGEGVFSYKLMEEYPDKKEEETIDMSVLSKSGYKIYDLAQTRQHIEQAKSIIDLHIEVLAPDYDHMSAIESLALQLKTFEKYLDLAIFHHLPSMVVIHGVGSGKLRDEIHEILRTKSEIRTFVNQYHPSFGYGATEIYFGK